MPCRSYIFIVIETDNGSPPVLRHNLWPMGRSFKTGSTGYPQDSILQHTSTCIPLLPYFSIIIRNYAFLAPWRLKEGAKQGSRVKEEQEADIALGKNWAQGSEEKKNPQTFFALVQLHMHVVVCQRLAQGLRRMRYNVNPDQGTR